MGNGRAGPRVRADSLGLLGGVLRGVDMEGALPHLPPVGSPRDAGPWHPPDAREAVRSVMTSARSTVWSCAGQLKRGRLAAIATCRMRQTRRRQTRRWHARHNIPPPLKRAVRGSRRVSGKGTCSARCDRDAPDASHTQVARPAQYTAAGCGGRAGDHEARAARGVAIAASRARPLAAPASRPPPTPA